MPPPPPPPPLNPTSLSSSAGQDKTRARTCLPPAVYILGGKPAIREEKPTVSRGWRKAVVSPGNVAFLVSSNFSRSAQGPTFGGPNAASMLTAVQSAKSDTAASDTTSNSNSKTQLESSQSLRLEQHVGGISPTHLARSLQQSPLMFDYDDEINYQIDDKNEDKRVTSPTSVSSSLGHMTDNFRDCHASSSAGTENTLGVVLDSSSSKNSSRPARGSARRSHLSSRASSLAVSARASSAASTATTAAVTANGLSPGELQTGLIVGKPLDFLKDQAQRLIMLKKRQDYMNWRIVKNSKQKRHAEAKLRRLEVLRNEIVNKTNVLRELVSRLEKSTLTRLQLLTEVDKKASVANTKISALLKEIEEMESELDFSLAAATYSLQNSVNTSNEKALYKLIRDKRIVLNAKKAELKNIESQLKVQQNFVQEIEKNSIAYEVKIDEFNALEKKCDDDFEAEKEKLATVLQKRSLRNIEFLHESVSQYADIAKNTLLSEFFRNKTEPLYHQNIRLKKEIERVELNKASLEDKIYHAEKEISELQISCKNMSPRRVFDPLSGSLHSEIYKPAFGKQRF